jgi:hypothetical protein
MRIVVRGAGAVVALVVTLVVSGCASSPQPSPTPSPSVTPLFQSDDEALAAAQEAYAAYQRVEDEILAEGGVDGTRIEKVAIREALIAAQTGFKDFVENGYRSVGSVSFDSMELQSHDQSTSNNQNVVTAYLCLDFSAQDVLDVSGNSVVRSGRPLRQPFEVSFDFDPTTSTLVLSQRDPWAGEQLCLQ